MVPAQRGAIYDGSYTRPLVANRPAFSIDVTPALVPGDRDDLDALLASLAEALDVDPEYMAGQVPLNESHLFQPIEVLSGADFPTVAYLGEHIHRFQGVSWRNEPVRDYSDLGALAHVTIRRPLRRARVVLRRPATPGISECVRRLKVEHR